MSQATEGNSAGVLKAPPVTSGAASTDCKIISSTGGGGLITPTRLEELIHDRHTVHLLVTVSLADNHEVTWNTYIRDQKMFVDIPAGILPQGSKQSYVTLLEFAEGLRFSHVIVCFKKDRADRAALMRMFMFLGLIPVAPGHALAPEGSLLSTVGASTVSASSEQLVFMAYAVDDGSTTEDEE